MKTLIALLTAAFLLAAPAIRAQDAPKRERPNRSFGMFGLPQQISEKLSLTDEQKKKAREIMDKYRPQLEEVRKKMMEEFRGTLTDEQKKTMDTAIEQLRQRAQQGRGEAARSQRGESGDPKSGNEGEKK